MVGSSAGAGSGDFHVYRAHRRREMARIRIMEAEAKEASRIIADIYKWVQETEKKEFEENLKKRREMEEELTAKRRAKRQKRKMRKQQATSVKVADGEQEIIQNI